MELLDLVMCQNMFPNLVWGMHTDSKNSFVLTFHHYEVKKWTYVLFITHLNNCIMVKNVLVCLFKSIRLPAVFAIWLPTHALHKQVQTRSDDWWNFLQRNVKYIACQKLQTYFPYSLHKKCIVALVCGPNCWVSLPIPAVWADCQQDGLQSQAARTNRGPV